MHINLFNFLQFSALQSDASSALFSHCAYMFYLICCCIVEYSIPLIDDDDDDIQCADGLSEECINCAENLDDTYGRLSNYHRL